VTRRQVASNARLPHISEASIGQRSVAHQRGFVESQEPGASIVNARPRFANSQRYSARSAASADATMRHEIGRLSRRGMVPQIGWRSNTTKRNSGPNGTAIMSPGTASRVRIPASKPFGHDIDQLCFGDDIDPTSG